MNKIKYEYILSKDKASRLFSIGEVDIQIKDNTQKDTIVIKLILGNN